jgi:hypothetical protein
MPEARARVEALATRRVRVVVVVVRVVLVGA